METPKFTYGADPEFFVVKVKDPNDLEARESAYYSNYISYRHKLLVPVPFSTLGICKGTKKDAVPFTYSTPRGKELTQSWLVDGATCELNTPPRRLFGELQSDIRTAVGEMNRLIKAACGHNFILTPYPIVAELSPTDLELPVVRTLGCDPDKLAFTNEDRPAMEAANIDPFRFTGRHIHVGLDPWPENLPKYVAVRILSLLFYENNFPELNRRSKWYGIPGLYRETKYGVELRFPDNLWWENDGHWTTLWETVVKKNCAGDAEDLMRWHSDVDWIGAEREFLRCAEQQEEGLSREFFNIVQQDQLRRCLVPTKKGLFDNVAPPRFAVRHPDEQAVRRMDAADQMVRAAEAMGMNVADHPILVDGGPRADDELEPEDVEFVDDLENDFDDNEDADNAAAGG